MGRTVLKLVRLTTRAPMGRTCGVPDGIELIDRRSRFVLPLPFQAGFKQNILLVVYLSLGTGAFGAVRRFMFQVSLEPRASNLPAHLLWCGSLRAAYCSCVSSWLRLLASAF